MWRDAERTRLLAAVLPTALLCGALAAAEGGLRLLKGAPFQERLPGDFELAYVEAAKPFFLRERRGGKTVYRAQRRGAEPAEFEMPKPPGSFRMFIIGGSVGQPFGHGSMLAADALWRQAAAPHRVELIAASVPGYGSRLDLATLEEVLSYEPDLIAVLTGHDESPMANKLWARAFLLNHALRRSWAWRLTQEALAPRIKPRHNPWRIVEQRFESHLRAMAQAARRADVPLVLCTLPSNLRDAAPARAIHARTEPLHGDALYAEGWRAWRAGDAARARSWWARFVESEPRDPYGAYYLGRANDKLGRLAEARGYYRRAADLTPPPDNRCSPARNGRIRRIAREEGVFLADLERLFDGLSAAGVPGLELMRDSRHWYDEYYPLVMTELLAATHRTGGAVARRLALDWAWLEAAQGRLRNPEISQAKRRSYAITTLRSGLLGAIAAPPGAMSEYALTLLEGGSRAAPEDWRALLRSPEAIARLLGASGGVASRESAARYGEEDWAAIRAHVAEASRRRGEPEVSFAARGGAR